MPSKRASERILDLIQSRTTEKNVRGLGQVLVDDCLGQPRWEDQATSGRFDTDIATGKWECDDVGFGHVVDQERHIGKVDVFALCESFIQIDGEDVGCFSHPAENHVLGRAFVLVAHAADVMQEGHLSFHARCNGEESEVLEILEEDGEAMLLGFDDGGGHLV